MPSLDKIIQMKESLLIIRINPTHTKVHWDKTDKFQIKVIRIQASKLVSLMDHDKNFR